MKVSYNWIKEWVKNLPRPEKLADLLTMHSFEVKAIEKSGNDYLLDIDILPNRAHDCLCHLGIAKECAALLKSKLKTQKLKLIESKKTKAANFINIEIKDKDGCPRYTARMITGVKITPSPQWLQDKLKAIGQKPINNVVDAANYVMFEMGQPLHVFDYEKIEGKSRPQSGSRQGSGKTIVIRKAKNKEKITTLDGEICELDESILVIADSKDVLALAGVKGGTKAEITPKTKTIVLESANFGIHAVRNTVRKTGIKTDASIRFEHGLDPNLAQEAMDRVAWLIREIAKGEIAKGLIDVYPQKVLARKIKLNPEKVENVLGMKIPNSEIAEILTSLGFEADNSLKVTIPTIRQDIEIEEDLIEEISRVIGYDNIPTQQPFGLLGASKLNDDLTIINKVKSIFEGLGFNEVYNFSFVGESDIEKLKSVKDGYLELENPLSVDLKYMRRDLLVNLLKNLKDNAKNFLNTERGIKIFELGKVYHGLKDGAVKEEKMLSGIIAWKNEKTKGEKFYELKGVIDSLLNKLGISDQWYDDFEATPEWTDEIFWQKTGTAEIKIGDEEVGFLGQMNSMILNKLNINGIIVAFNLNFEKVLKLAEEELIYEPPSPYPAAVRDLAIFVDLDDKMADVLNVIETAGGKLVQDVDLFDMYEGEGIPGGRKSLAFHIIYQSYEKTLKDEEVDKIHRKIIRELEKNKNWQVRK
jgi:phenylalanyl-tRNA synthetase beta chain